MTEKRGEDVDTNRGMAGLRLTLMDKARAGHFESLIESSSSRYDQEGTTVYIVQGNHTLSAIRKKPADMLGEYNI